MSRIDKKTVKVYFDQQIWAFLSKGIIDSNILENATKKSECQYYLSVAHLEELHSAEKKESDNAKGLTSEQEEFMKKRAVPGVIKETFEGVKFYPGEMEYKIARGTVWNVDTINAVQEISDIGLSAQQSNGIEAKTLFEGRQHNLDTEYKDVWDIDIVKQLLMRLGISGIKYQNIKGDFCKLNDTMALMFGVLLRRDISEILTQSYTIPESMISNMP